MVRGIIALVLALATIVPSALAQAPLGLGEPVRVTALAVALTTEGEFVGASAEVSVSVATGGSGHVFIDTRPLAGTDMQGSARMAARVGAALTGYPLEEHDLFFVIRSESPIIAGPSAGGVMALAAAVALHNAHADAGDAWDLDPAVMATGTISPDGTIGPVGGILEKAQAARQAGASLFLVPEGQGEVGATVVEQGLIATTEVVNVAAYCQDELHITCLEVGTLEELLERATGEQILHDEPATPPSTADYTETMRPLSTELISDANAYRDVWERFNASTLGAGAHDEVLAALEEAHRYAKDASRHFANEAYYSAASRAFSTSIYGTQARLLLDFFEGGRSLDAVEAAVRDANRLAREAQSAAARANVTGMHTLYTVGAAQARVSDAQSYVASAWASLNQSDVGTALFNAAWAMERSETVHWWISLSEHFGDGPELPVPVEQLADEFIDLADESLAYTSEVLKLPQGPPEAVEQLARAKADEARAFYAAAIIEAAQSQVIATLTIELAPNVAIGDKVNTSREQAARAIADARASGVEPVLAVAMYEFGGAQLDGPAARPDLALQFYRQARVLAGLAQVFTTDADPAESRFVGHWEAPLHGASALPRGAFRAVALGWFAAGVFSMAALVAFGAALIERKRGR